MKLRLVKTDSEYKILCLDGTIAAATKSELNKLLFGFKKPETITGIFGKWNTEYPEMISYPGETFAYVTDNYNLVIEDFSPFSVLLNKSSVHDSVITASEYGKKHGKSIEQVKVFCRQGRIPGAVKIGRTWLLPIDAPYPEDRRISNGRYCRR